MISSKEDTPMRNCKLMSVKSIFLAAALVWLLPAFAAAQAVTIQLIATDVFDPYDANNDNSYVGQFMDYVFVNLFTEKMDKDTDKDRQKLETVQKLNISK
jgi:hypothetical protein